MNVLAVLGLSESLTLIPFLFFRSVFFSLLHVQVSSLCGTRRLFLSSPKCHASLSLPFFFPNSRSVHCSLVTPYHQAVHSWSLQQLLALKFRFYPAFVWWRLGDSLSEGRPLKGKCYDTKIKSMSFNMTIDMHASTCICCVCVCVCGDVCVCVCVRVCVCV